MLLCSLLDNVQSTRRVLVPTQVVALSHTETLLRAHRPASLDQVHDSVLVKVSLVVGVQIKAFTDSVHQVVLSTTSFCQFDWLWGAFSDLRALLGARIRVYLSKRILMVDQLRWTRHLLLKNRHSTVSSLKQLVLRHSIVVERGRRARWFQSSPYARVDKLVLCKHIKVSFRYSLKVDVFYLLMMR